MIQLTAMDPEETSEPGELEGDDSAEVASQQTLTRSGPLGAHTTESETSKQQVAASLADQEDDGEISESGTSDASSELAENPESPDAEQNVEDGNQVFSSRTGKTQHNSLDMLGLGDGIAGSQTSEQNAKYGGISNPDAEEGYFDDDDRSQTPLQDEPDAVSELDSRDADANESEIDKNASAGDQGDQNQEVVKQSKHVVGTNSGGSDAHANSHRQSATDSKLQTGGSLEPLRKQSVRDDLGELDYEEDDNEDEVSGEATAESSGEEGGDEHVSKKVSKKESRKRQKAVKEDDEEKVCLYFVTLLFELYLSENEQYLDHKSFILCKTGFHENYQKLYY
jgi:hypothetical protein